MIPRIQGKVGQATEPADVAGKWFFELWFSTLGGGEPESMGLFGPYETEKEAFKGLKKASELACDTLAELVPGGQKGEYIDMKTNLRRRWDRKDEH